HGNSHSMCSANASPDGHSLLHDLPMLPASVATGDLATFAISRSPAGMIRSPIGKPHPTRPGRAHSLCLLVVPLHAPPRESVVQSPPRGARTMPPHPWEHTVYALPPRADPLPVP